MLARMYSSYSFFSLTLDGVSGQRHALAAFCRRERTAGTHWTGGWVGSRDGLDTEARRRILCLCQGSNVLSSYLQSDTIRTEQVAHDNMLLGYCYRTLLGAVEDEYGTMVEW